MQDVAWEALVSEPGTGVSINTIEGRTLWCNDACAKMFHGERATPADVIGKSWREQGFPEPWIAERIAILERIHERGEPELLRTIWRGRQQFSWTYPIPGDDEGEPSFLVITRRIPGSEEADKLEGVRLTESGVARLGKLDVLSARELEVLALIGRGLSNKEISQILGRSEKTVDNHRQSIVRKIGEGGCVRLAEIARLAGLEVQDRDRRRV